jgi:hemerythrin-like metal-binding protein
MYDIVDWGNQLDFGHPVIDAQHREIMTLGQEIEDSFDRKIKGPELLAKLTEFCRLLSNHFALELGLMEALSNSVYARHVDKHRLTHEHMTTFITATIRGLANGGDAETVYAEFPRLFVDFIKNIVMDDNELISILRKEKVLTLSRD